MMTAKITTITNNPHATGLMVDSADFFESLVGREDKLGMRLP